MIDSATEALITSYLDADLSELALKGIPPFVLNQIEGRRAAKRKLPSWYETKGIVYPGHLAMEQCSSEATAKYKAVIAQKLLGKLPHLPNKIVEITSGLGVDFLEVSKAIGGPGGLGCTYIEKDPELCRLAEVNLPLLGLPQAEILCQDGAEFILRSEEKWAAILADPSRRNSSGKRVYGIHDCSPDVTHLIPALVSKAYIAIIKLSPMLDPYQAIRELEASGKAKISEIHIVASGDECKELLMVARSSESVRDGQRKLYCACNEEVIEFPEEKSSEHLEVRLPSSWEGLYLYEPNPAIMKSGRFTDLEHLTGTRQIAPNSHLYLSEKCLRFPGRRFLIERICSLNKRETRSILDGVDSANISVRNFHMSAEELRKRLRLKDGGEWFLFATTTETGKGIIMLCKKL